MNVHLFFAFLASAAAATQTPANPGQQVSSTQPAGVRRGAGDGANISEAHAASALGELAKGSSSTQAEIRAWVAKRQGAETEAQLVQRHLSRGPPDDASIGELISWSLSRIPRGDASPVPGAACTLRAPLEGRS